MGTKSGHETHLKLSGLDIQPAKRCARKRSRRWDRSRYIWIKLLKQKIRTTYPSFSKIYKSGYGRGKMYQFKMGKSEKVKKKRLA